MLLRQSSWVPRACVLASDLIALLQVRCPPVMLVILIFEGFHDVRRKFSWGVMLCLYGQKHVLHRIDTCLVAFMLSSSRPADDEFPAVLWILGTWLLCVLIRSPYS